MISFGPDSGIWKRGRGGENGGKVNLLDVVLEVSPHILPFYPIYQLHLWTERTHSLCYDCPFSSFPRKPRADGGIPSRHVGISR